MLDTTVIIKELIQRFDKKRAALPVNFRQLVSWLPYNVPRFTHTLHPYPAKIIPQIPNFFLNDSAFLAPGCKILDPFSGSGTVLLEAALKGKNSVGSDSNPLARLVSRVETW